jgi:hypothetical protein
MSVALTLIYSFMPLRLRGSLETLATVRHQSALGNDSYVGNKAVIAAVKGNLALRTIFGTAKFQ